MGVDPEVRPGLRSNREDSYLRNYPQDTDPEASPHHGFCRLLSLAGDWLICLSCDHTWCCLPVVGNIPFAPRSHVQPVCVPGIGPLKQAPRVNAEMGKNIESNNTSDNTTNVSNNAVMGTNIST